MNWKLVECEIALIVSLTVIECVNMGQNSPKDITCLTVFFCIMIVLLPLIGVLQQWHLSCFQNRQKEKEYQAKQETDEKMKTWLLAREAIIKDKEKEELTNKVNGLQQKCDSLIENQENEYTTRSRIHDDSSEGCRVRWNICLCFVGHSSCSL